MGINRGEEKHIFHHPSFFPLPALHSLFSISKMSLLMNSGRENTVKRSSNIGLCSYCHKTFNDLRALGEHLRTHRGHALSRKSPLNATEAAPRPLMGAPQSSAAPPVFPRRFGYENWGNDGKYPENAIGNAKASFLVSANISPDGDRAEICHFQSWSYQINSEQSRSFGDGGQFSENTFPSIQNRSQGNFLIPRSGSHHVPVFKEPTNVGPVFPGQNQYSGLGESDGYNNGKRHYVGEDFPVPAMVKKARAECSLMIDEAERRLNSMKELSLFQDSAYGKSLDTVENPKPVIDLTLRL